MKYINNSTHNQRLAILGWFKTHKSLTTLEARNELGIMHPGGRILELRKSGYDIKTHQSTELDSLEKPHRVARYVLHSRRPV